MTENSPPLLGRDDPLSLKLAELAELEADARRRANLPHLYGWGWYPWARKYFESRNRFNLLCAANQISKSSTNIRKCIDWATNKMLWPSLWRERPRQFWYLYPSRDVTGIEFETKWPLFLPKPELKDDPVYGWKEEWRNKALFAVRFHSGVNVYFKTYYQDVVNLQTGTVDAIFCDEELPIDLLDELLLRLAATDGYFHMVFTATLGQEHWRRAIQAKNKEEELYPDAFKIQVSMFDCLKYEDGTESHWTIDKIQRQVALCSTRAQVQRRIHGKFAIDEGLVYESFDRVKNMKPRKKGFTVPLDWHHYGACDSGSGGQNNHPAACLFLAVAPDFRSARVWRGWRGDKITTTSGDLVQKFLELRGSLVMSAQVYDGADKDFETISSAMNQAFTPANKAHAYGENLVNVLFKNGMLTIYEGDPELEKLATELETLRKETPKNKAADDLSDTLRYVCAEVPWDLSWIVGELTEDEKEQAEKAKDELLSPSEFARREEMKARRAGFDGEVEATDSCEEEMRQANELYEG